MGKRPVKEKKKKKPPPSPPPISLGVLYYLARPQRRLFPVTQHKPTLKLLGNPLEGVTEGTMASLVLHAQKTEGGLAPLSPCLSMGAARTAGLPRPHKPTVSRSGPGLGLLGEQTTAESASPSGTNFVHAHRQNRSSSKLPTYRLADLNKKPTATPTATANVTANATAPDQEPPLNTSRESSSSLASREPRASRDLTTKDGLAAELPAAVVQPNAGAQGLFFEQQQKPDLNEINHKLKLTTSGQLAPQHQVLQEGTSDRPLQAAPANGLPKPQKLFTSGIPVPAPAPSSFAVSSPAQAQAASTLSRPRACTFHVNHSASQPSRNHSDTVNSAVGGLKPGNPAAKTPSSLTESQSAKRLSFHGIQVAAPDGEKTTSASTSSVPCTPAVAEPPGDNKKTPVIIHAGVKPPAAAAAAAAAPATSPSQPTRPQSVRPLTSVAASKDSGVIQGHDQQRAAVNVRAEPLLAAPASDKPTEEPVRDTRHRHAQKELLLHTSSHAEGQLGVAIRPLQQAHSSSLLASTAAAVASLSAVTAPAAAAAAAAAAQNSPPHRPQSDEKRVGGGGGGGGGAPRRPPISFKPPVPTPGGTSPRAVIPPIRAFRSSGSRRNLVLDMNIRSSDPCEPGDDSPDVNHRDRSLRALEGRGDDEALRQNQQSYRHKQSTSLDSGGRDGGVDDRGDMFLRVARDEFAQKWSEGGREGSKVVSPSLVQVHSPPMPNL